MEELRRKNDIEIKLLSNRRFIYANRKSNIVITAEHSATEITVNFPEEYENYSKRVDFINSQGKPWTEGLYIPEYKEYPAPFNKSLFTFTLPNEVTTPGELRMQFMAYMPDNSLTIVPFEIVPIHVDDGITVFKKGGKNTPDLLLLSYNQSTEALFLAQTAKAKACKADEQSLTAIDIANAAEKTAGEAVTVSGDAREIAKNAVDKAAEAVATAQAAEKKATQAVNTAGSSNLIAEDAKSISGRALNTASYAQNRANEAVDMALTAERNSNRAVSESTSALQYVNDANVKSDNAITKAGQAESIAALANEKSEKATATSITATGTAQTAVDKVDTAIMISEQAKGVALSVEDRANSGEFIGPPGPKGETGNDGIMFAIDNLIGLCVDESGCLYAYTGETSGINFRYDEESGELFLICQ